MHFNAYEQVDKPMGTEVLYLTQGALAASCRQAIAEAGELINRGAKKRTDLFVLNNTQRRHVSCWKSVSSTARPTPTSIARTSLTIVTAIADVLTDEEIDSRDVGDQTDERAAFHADRKVSVILAGLMIRVLALRRTGLSTTNSCSNQQLFLPYQPDGTTGLAAAT